MSVISLTDIFHQYKGRAIQMVGKPFEFGGEKMNIFFPDRTDENTAALIAEMEQTAAQHGFTLRMRPEPTPAESPKRVSVEVKQDKKYGRDTWRIDNFKLG